MEFLLLFITSYIFSLLYSDSTLRAEHCYESEYIFLIENFHKMKSNTDI